MTGRSGQQLAGDITTITAFEVPLPTPPAGVALAGFLPVRQWDGTGGGLSASFLMVEQGDGQTIVLVAVDTLFLDDGFQALLQQRLSKNISIVLVASHTHFAPALAKSVQSLGSVDEEYYQAVLACIAKAIMTGTGLSSAYIGHFTAPTNMTVNRRREGWMIDCSALRRGRINFAKGISLAENPDGIVDHNLYCVSFRDADGNPVACIWSLAAHAAFMDAYRTLSPDFPGRVRWFLKERFGPHFVSIYIPGLAGSAIPNSAYKPFSRQTNKERLLEVLPFHHAIRPLDPAGYEVWSRRVGEMIAGPLPSLDFKRTAGITAHHESLRSDPVFYDRACQELSLNLNIVRLGNEVEIITSNGELLGEWKPLLDQLPRQSGMRVVSGYAAGACLYVPPASEIRRGGYEADRFREAFGLDGNFVEGIDVNVFKAFKKLLTKV